MYSRTHLMARVRFASWLQRVKQTEIRLGPVISARYPADYVKFRQTFKVFCNAGRRARVRDP